MEEQMQSQPMVTGAEGQTSGKMSKVDIVQVLNQTLSILKLNREIMQDDVLLKLQGLIEEAKKMSRVLEKVMSLPPERVAKIFEALDKFMETEKMLVKTDMGEKIEKTIEGLLNNSLALNALSFVL